jgi:hypothetical protein
MYDSQNHHLIQQDSFECSNESMRCNYDGGDGRSTLQI